MGNPHTRAEPGAHRHGRTSLPPQGLPTRQDDQLCVPFATVSLREAASFTAVSLVYGGVGSLLVVVCAIRGSGGAGVHVEVRQEREGEGRSHAGQSGRWAFLSPSLAPQH